MRRKREPLARRSQQDFSRWWRAGLHEPLRREEGEAVMSMITDLEERDANGELTDWALACDALADHADDECEMCDAMRAALAVLKREPIDGHKDGA